MNVPTHRRFLAACALACAAALTLAAPAAAQDQAKHVVVHIGQYSNDLHSAAMGLGLAGLLQERGARVTVFLDREGVRLAETGQPLLIYGDTDTGELLRTFIDGGGRVLVCPHCAQLGGVEAAELRPGIEMGTRAAVADLIMAADLVVSY
jgi:sulfur relay (sulfurtransferase) complex TusBCD TusD component (DsrE family)